MAWVQDNWSIAHVTENPRARASSRPGAQMVSWGPSFSLHLWTVQYVVGIFWEALPSRLESVCSSSSSLYPSRFKFSMKGRAVFHDSSILNPKMEPPWVWWAISICIHMYPSLCPGSKHIVNIRPSVTFQRWDLVRSTKCSLSTWVKCWLRVVSPKHAQGILTSESGYKCQAAQTANTP